MDFNTMYNPYMAQSAMMQSRSMYGGYGMQPQNTLPQQQVMTIDGPESIQQLRMAPNSSVILMEKNRAIVWLCASDAVGNITPTAYDIAPHVDAPPVDTASLEARVTNMENNMQSIIARMEELTNGKSNAGSTKSKQSGGKSGESGAD